jgi:hypothetical protein
LKSSVNGISALWKEEDVLRGGKQTVLDDGFEEVEVAFSENQGWAPGVFGAGEFGEPTRRRRIQEKSGGRNRAESAVRLRVAGRKGIGRGFGTLRHRCLPLAAVLPQVSPEIPKPALTTPKTRSR